MPRFLYPSVAEAEEMHRQLIQEFGGIQGIRDRGLLEAAIFRPQSGYYDDLVHEAAALMESLANNIRSSTEIKEQVSRSRTHFCGSMATMSRSRPLPRTSS